MKKVLVVLVWALLIGVCALRTSAQNPNFVGSFDSVDCIKIVGWAADENRLNTPINVSVYVDGTLVTTVLANGFRQDVVNFFQNNGIQDNGNHGFNVTTPLALRNGQSHSVSIRYESTTTELISSPRSSSACAPPTATTIPNPKITTFEITNSGDTTKDPNLNLNVQIDHPDRVHFFRLGEIACPESVSDRPEDRMKNLQWQAYSLNQSFTFRLNTNIAQPYGTRCVFMEVNTTQNESSASAAKGDSIVLAPANLKTFTLTGSDLKKYIDRAKALGYKFTLTDRSVSGNSPCPNGTVPDTSSLTPANPAKLFESTTATLFDRGERFLNPFWKMTGISIPGGTGVSVTFSGPPSGRADDPLRTVGIKRGFSVVNGGEGINHDTAGNITCVPGGSFVPEPFDTATIKSITLEGPDDKQPQDAFFDGLNTVPRILLRPSIRRRF